MFFGFESNRVKDCSSHLYCVQMMKKPLVVEADRYRADIQILPSKKHKDTVRTCDCRLSCQRDTCYLSVVEVEKRFQGVGQGARAAVDILSAAYPTIGAVIHVQI